MFNSSIILPAAKAYFISLHDLPVTREFNDCLSAFKEPKNLTMDNLLVGIKLFAEVANLAPEKRKAFFGTPYGGLHYSAELNNIWNQNSPIKSEMTDLYLLAPTPWEYCYQNGLRYLYYKGDNLAGALDKLIRGPTTLDCGMFCQLSIWFGLR